MNTRINNVPSTGSGGGASANCSSFGADKLDIASGDSTVYTTTQGNSAGSWANISVYLKPSGGAPAATPFSQAVIIC